MWYVLMFVCGLALWTFLEYGTHRWILHGPLHKHHRLHHMFPKRIYRVPWWVAYPALALLGWLVEPMLAAGVWAGWMLSGVVHDRMHEGRSTNRVFKFLQMRHALHHRYDTVNYGVICSFWDVMLGTEACN